MLALEEARKQSAANIRIKLGEFGEPWMKGWKYSECCIMFECGTPDMMWLYAQSPGLSMVNSFVQVRVHNYYLYISTRVQGKNDLTKVTNTNTYSLKRIFIDISCFESVV